MSVLSYGRRITEWFRNGCPKTKERLVDMFVQVSGNHVKVYNDNGMIHRDISCSGTVSSAQINGDMVNVQLANGHCVIYTKDGLMKRFV